MTDAVQPSDDASMIRSEERLRVGTRRVPVRRAILRRTVVVEQRTITVEVRHEEVHLEIVDDDGTGRAPLTGEHVDLPEYDLHEEEVVVTKRIVPTERVRLRVVPVTVEQQVTADVRHEEISTSGDLSPA